MAKTNDLKNVSQNVQYRKKVCVDLYMYILSVHTLMNDKNSTLVAKMPGWRKELLLKLKKKYVAKKKYIYSLSFVNGGEKSLTRPLQSTPFQNPGALP